MTTTTTTVGRIYNGTFIGHRFPVVPHGGTSWPGFFLENDKNILCHHSGHSTIVHRRFSQRRTPMYVCIYRGSPDNNLDENTCRRCVFLLAYFPLILAIIGLFHVHVNIVHTYVCEYSEFQFIHRIFLLRVLRAYFNVRSLAIFISKLGILNDTLFSKKLFMY